MLELIEEPTKVSMLTFYIYAIHTAHAVVEEVLKTVRDYCNIGIVGAVRLWVVADPKDKKLCRIYLT